MHLDCRDVWAQGDRVGYHHIATCGELRQAGTRVGHRCHCYKSGAAPKRRDHQERSGRQMRRWREHVEGGRSCPDSIVEREAVKKRERKRKREREGRKHGENDRKQKVKGNLNENRVISLT